jgi:hypothetical protein
MVHAVRVVASLSFTVVLACSVTDVGTPSGVFPCETADECPDEQACVVGKCYAGNAPTVEIVTPEDEQAVPWTPGAEDIEVSVKIGGSNLELVDPASDADSVFGRGQIVLFVDEREVETLTFGSLASGVPTTVLVAPTPGAHRIRAEARFSDGKGYDNVEAVASRVFWFDDGNPWIAFKTPLPNQRFSFEEISIDVTVAVLNFEIVPAVGNTTQEGRGHAHLLFNKVFPDCEFDAVCRQDYIKVLAPLPPSESLTSVTVESTIPSSAAGAPTTLTAAISEINHTTFLNAADQPVWDTIPIVRIEAPAPEPDTDG